MYILKHIIIINWFLDKENNKYKTTKGIELIDGNNNQIERKVNNILSYKNIGYVKISDNKISLKTEFENDFNIVVINNESHYIPINNNKYKYYVYGKSSSGSSKGNIGYFYPLSLKSYGNDILCNFNEYPNINFYIPKSNFNISQTKPSSYFFYDDLNINNNLDGVYGNVIGLTKNKSFVNLSLNLMNYFYYKKINSSELSSVVGYSESFLSNTNYFMKVNDVYCYGIYDGTNLNILSINDFLITQKSKLFYVKTSLSNSDILTTLLNRKSIPISDNFVLNDFTILEDNRYNYYCNSNTTFLSYDSYIMEFDSSNIKNNYPQKYKNFKQILDVILFNINKSDTSLNVKIYSATESILPPVKYENNEINTFNSNDTFNWLKNGGYLNINEVNYNVNSIDNLSIDDGNYLTFYTNSDKIPDRNIYTDLYENKKIVVSNVNLDVFTKKLTTSEDIKIDNVIEVNNIKYQIVDIDKSSSNTLTLKSSKSNKIDINIKDTNIYYRPIVYSNNVQNFNYDFYDNLETTKSDNYKVIPQSDVSSSKIFLNKLIFNSSHTSETLVVKTSNNNIEITKNSNLNYTISLKDSSSLIIWLKWYLKEMR